jgi:hypothetical protein
MPALPPLLIHPSFHKPDDHNSVAVEFMRSIDAPPFIDNYPLLHKPSFHKQLAVVLNEDACRGVDATRTSQGRCTLGPEEIQMKNDESSMFFSWYSTT